MVSPLRLAIKLLAFRFIFYDPSLNQNNPNDRIINIYEKVPCRALSQRALLSVLYIKVHISEKVAQRSTVYFTTSHTERERLLRVR